ncbi:MAG: cytochrome c biogenesis CcdA family protein [Candidatus Nanoarchaeia archaeon]
MPIEGLGLATVVGVAAVDSINPCAIGVLVLLIAALLKIQNPKRMLLAGSIYISVVYITYFIAGIGLLYFIQQWGIADIVGMIVAILIILGGMVEIKDFLWYGVGFSLTIPPSYVSTIKKWANKGTIPAMVVLGFFVAAVELPCTGGPYLAIMSLLARGTYSTAIYYLLIYNLVFILPLVAILILAYSGTRIGAIKKWKMEHRHYMRLATGIVMILLGLLLIAFIQGWINTGAF